MLKPIFNVWHEIMYNTNLLLSDDIINTYAYITCDLIIDINEATCFQRKLKHSLKETKTVFGSPRLYHSQQVVHKH